MKHRELVLALLQKQIGNEDEVGDIARTADEVASKWVDPVSGGAAQTNGLIYGLIQSGKTGVLTVTGAIGADQGYRTILILTSDNDALYDQTLKRVREAFPGIDIIGKREFKDINGFLQRIKVCTCAIVSTKNAGLLRTLIDNFRSGNVRGLSCLIIDDEADQASLNTRASKADGSLSAINERITVLRSYFEKNTYLQVTATPQALFLQAPGHDFRPGFTVLSHPGSAYVGGEAFFGDDSQLVREFDINDIVLLAAGAQPSPTLQLPASLRRALDTFMVGATFKRTQGADQNCAFLCHVSTRTSDHVHIVELLRKYKSDLTSDVKSHAPKVRQRLSDAYDDLCSTHHDLKRLDLSKIIEDIGFLAPGITVKLVNGNTDEDVAVESPFNLFVGGNKLGRGVTIKNLLVSYYGRNPKSPQADTVLQHARMYGYRRHDIGLLRLFLPRALHVVYRAINKMEQGLRDLIARQPTEEFRGIYLERGLSPTRKSILAPGSIGMYSGGGTYNPAQVKRDHAVVRPTQIIDGLVGGIGNKSYKEVSIEELRQVIELTVPDDEASERIWNVKAISESLAEFAKLHGQGHGYLYVDRERARLEKRRETQGILVGTEGQSVPLDKITLFLLRTVADGSRHASWWPQIRFPQGRYAFAFAV
jgi:hypothetical protein